MRCCLIAIEHTRNDKGLTREDLAERIRKSECYVAAIERGERTPSLKTCDTYVHSMDEHKRREMDKMDDMFGMQYSISVENQPYPVLCTLSADGCTAHVPDFPKIVITASTLDAALLEVKQQIQKALRQYKNPPIPTKQEQIVVPNNSVLVPVSYTHLSPVCMSSTATSLPKFLTAPATPTKLPPCAPRLQRWNIPY